MYLLTSPTAYIISGRVKVRYLRLPTKLLNNVGFTDSLVELMLSFILVSAGMFAGLASTRTVLSLVGILYLPGLSEHIPVVARCRLLLQDNHSRMLTLHPSEKSSTGSVSQ